MTTDDIRETVDRHSCRIRGITCRFKLRWAAAETESDRAVARHLLRIEVSAIGEPGDAPVTLHVLTRGDGVTDLPALLTDALYHHLEAASGTDERREAAVHVRA